MKTPSRRAEAARRTAGGRSAEAARPAEERRRAGAGAGLIEDFGRYLVAELGASPHTVKAYETDVRQLAAFLAAAGSTLARADVHGVRGYLASLSGAQRKSS